MNQISHESPAIASLHAVAGRSAAARVLAGSAIGIAFGSVPFFAAGFPVLAAAWKTDQGWTDGQIARAASAFLLMQIAAAPLTGALLDRFGTRRIATTSIVLFAATLLALAATRTPAGLILVFGAMSLTTAGTNVIAYARAIALHFDRGRGLSLGVASAAQAVGVIVIPNAARLLIATGGWPSVPELLAAAELFVCLPAVALLLPPPPPPVLRSSRPTPPATSSLRAILRQPSFPLLAAGAFIQGFTFYAILPNLGLAVSRSHLSPASLAVCTSLAGLCFLLGRLLTGAWLDRASARTVGPAIACLAACALLCFASARSLPLALAGGCLLGLAGGGETDLLPYAASRYFGEAAVSRGYGALLVAFFAGAAAGPVGFVSAVSPLGVAPALAALAVLQAVPAVLLRRLLPYPGRQDQDDRSIRRAG